MALKPKCGSFDSFWRDAPRFAQDDHILFCEARLPLLRMTVPVRGRRPYGTLLLLGSSIPTLKRGASIHRAYGARLLGRADSLFSCIIPRPSASPKSGSRKITATRNPYATANIRLVVMSSIGLFCAGGELRSQNAGSSTRSARGDGAPLLELSWQKIYFAWLVS